MKRLRDAFKTIADNIGRMLTKELFPRDTAQVIPVSPFPPAVRIHREGEDRRRRR
jgi:hypothetical protein